MTTPHNPQPQAAPGNGGSVAMTAPKPRTPQQLLRDDLERAKDSLATMLPKHVTVDRLIKVVLSATARNEKLLECSRPSFLRAIMQSAELGLEIGGLLGEAYLVPFNRNWKDDAGNWHREKEVTCIVGYKGLIKLARQSGQIHSIGARVVHERDHFSVNLALEQIEHVPELRGEPGGLVLVYAIARFRDGGQQVEVMTRDQIEAIRKRSKTYNTKDGTSDGPWATDYEEMARKTVVRRLCKYLPLSPELQKALEYEEDRDAADRAEQARQVIDAHFTPDRPRTTALAERIQEQAKQRDAAATEPAPQPEIDQVTGEVVPAMREPGEEG